jgi:hypothetical protein
MEIGQKEREAEEAIEAAAGAFSRPLLLHFEATTARDSATIDSLVQALHRRVAAHAKVAIINAAQTSCRTRDQQPWRHVSDLLVGGRGTG